MARTAGSEGTRTEAAIRNAAIDLIATKGFEAVTLRQLADHVGLQAGSLYRYYPSKSEMLVSLITGHMDELLANWRDACPTTDDPVERLHAFVNFHVRFHAKKPREVYIANMELRCLGPDDRTRIVAMRKVYEDILRDILRAGVRAGIFSVPDVTVAAYAILAMLTGLTAWYRDGGRLTTEELVDCYWKLVATGLAQDPGDIVARGCADGAGEPDAGSEQRRNGRRAGRVKAREVDPSAA